MGMGSQADPKMRTDFTAAWGLIGDNTPNGDAASAGPVVRVPDFDVASNEKKQSGQA